jgi:diguanylate cyclase (GGDEF)-like protein
VIYEEDQHIFIQDIQKENLLNALQKGMTQSIDYRLMISGRSQYFRMTVRKTSDGQHFIIGVENIDAEVRKEKQALKALNIEKELARRDELTGIKNKTAYTELEQSVQTNMDNGMDYLSFGILVCDANDLKMINDNEGHVAGDEYIKASAKLLCDIFSHSPVFRVGGDEFVVFLRGDDFTARWKLIEKLKDEALKNQATGYGPVLAAGMAEYEPETDSLVSEIFDRADKEMYKNKQELKDIAYTKS